MLPFALIDTGHGVGWIAHISRRVRLAQAMTEWGVSIMYRRTTINQGLLAGAVAVCLVALLVVLGGDHRLRRAAAVAAALGGLVWVAPLVLGTISPSHDFFLSRNVIPAVVPVAVVVGAACVAPRLRLLGGLFAVVLVALFCYATVQVQSHGYFQRPDWRSVARALGPATAPRAIIAANGFTADPLKIYLSRVNWVQPQSRKVLVYEVDVVGDRKQLPLQTVRFKLRHGRLIAYHPTGAPTPALVGPPGARLVDRFIVRNWIVGRFVLDRPRRLTIKQLLALAPQYFHRTPTAMLIFFQGASR
jgi:hypothetical protein